MSFSLTPLYSFHEPTDITPAFLERRGIRFLMLDLDNTIAAYSEHSPSDRILQWADKMKDRGIILYIVSNSAREGRVGTFAQALGVDAIMSARKPSRKGLLRAIGTSGFSAENSALVGDQIFTDTLAANRAGVVSIIVKPRQQANPILALRYALEAPFRAACKNREQGAADDRI